MDFLNNILNLLGFNRAEEAEEVGTTQPPIYSEEDRQLQYQLGDTEMLADIYNAQRTMENPQVELGARYMDKYRTKYPGGLATLMFQPRENALGSASPAGSIYNTLGDHHQIRLKSLEGLEKAGYAPEVRDETIFHELSHIGEFITNDLIKAGVIPPSLASDYGMRGTLGTFDGDLAHAAIHTMDDHYGNNQMRGRIPRGENLGPTEFNKEEVLSKLKSKTYDEIQAEINAEMKRVGKGNWSEKLNELIEQRDRAKASPTKSIEVTNEEAKNIVLAEQARVDNQNKNPIEQTLDAIFSKNLEDSMVAGIGRHQLDWDDGEHLTASEKQYNARLAKKLSDLYGFDVTNFSPENVAKMVDNMKRHTRASNELADMIIENYPFGYIKEKVTDGY